MLTCLFKFPRFSSLILCLFFIAGCSSQASDAETAFKNKDYERARELWLTEAEAGDAVAQNALGTMYYMGLGVKRDYRKALKWFEMGAKQGYPSAQRNAGMMHEHGLGTRQDFATAYMWFFAADKQGNEAANHYINTLINKLTPNQMIKARRIAHQYIVDPTEDYQPEPGMIDGPPSVEDMRESG